MKIVYAIVVGLSILICQFYITTAQVYYGQRLLGQRVNRSSYGSYSRGPYVSDFRSMLPLSYHRSYGDYDRVIRYYDCDCPFYGYSPYYNCECYSCGC